MTSLLPVMSADRTAVLLQESRVRMYEKTDRLFAQLMVLQWLAGIAAALLISPRTWIGETSAIHLHVWAAIFLGGAIASLPCYLAWKQPGRDLNRHVIAVAQMLSSGLLIHLTGGRIETHFHIFGSLALLAFYRDWRVLITATAVTTVDHMLRGWFWPQSIFGVFTPTHWRWIEHASWVVFEDVFLFVSIRLSNREMVEVAERSELETAAQRFAQAQGVAQIGSWDWTAATDSWTWSFENFRLLGLAATPGKVSREYQLNCVHPDDREAARAWSDTAMRTGEVPPVDIRIVHPDGEVRVLHNRATSEFDEHGKVRRILGTSQDVTEARNAEAALRESERTHRAIASELEVERTRLLDAQAAGRFGSWEVDLASMKVSWSDETFRIFETDKEQFQGTHAEFLAVVHPEDRGPVEAALASSFGQQGSHSFEHRLLLPDGRITFVEERWQLVYGDGGQPLRAVGTCHDITERRRAEEELRWKTALLEAQVNSSIDGILIIDPAATRSLQNQRFVELFKMPPAIAEEESDERRLRWVRDTVKDPEQFIARVAHLYAHPDEIGQDEIVLKDGTILDRYSSPVVGADGSRYGRIWTFRDITERKQSDETRAKLAAIVDSSSDPIIGKTLDGITTSWNAGAERLFGYQAEEIIGQPGVMIIPPDHQGEEAEFVERLRRGERVEHFETERVAKDGRRIEVSLSISPVRDAAGKLIGISKIARDITDRRKAEAALRESEEWFRTVLEASRDGLIVEDGEIVSQVNTACARIFGYDSPAEIAGKRLSELLPPNERERLSGYGAARARGENVPEVYEFKGRRKDGSLVPLEAAVATCVIAGNQYFATTIRDITQRKLDDAEREKINWLLVETSRQAGMAEVATSVLHNVGNVLNSVNVSCSVISDSVRRSRVGTVTKTAELLQANAGDLPGFFSSDPVGRSLPGFISKLAQRLAEEQALVFAETQALSRNIEHICEIVSVQQDYAKNIAGVREKLEVGALVEDAVRMNSAALIRHRVELIRQFAETPTLLVEKHKVLQILVNLIRNAKHALVDSEQANRQLTIQVGAENGHVAISVIDNGIGIAPENLARVFTHGFTTKKAGHGFGLHNGVLAAQQMGGRLSVQSDGLGCGARFTLELPRIDESKTP